MAVQAHPHAPARRDQQPLTLASLANALLLLGAQVGALVDDLAQLAVFHLAVFHLAVPAVGRIALDSAADRCVEPIRDALRQHVQLDAEVPPATGQVAQRSPSQLVLGHGDRLVDHQRAAALDAGQLVGAQLRLEGGEDRPALGLVALVQVPAHHVGIGNLVEG